MKKAVVIGSGIGGIASAIRLSKRGFQVTVFEKNAYLGGKLTNIQLGEYRFDAGPSLFTMPQLVDELFEICEEEPHKHFTYERLNEVCRYFYEDQTVIQGFGDAAIFAKECEIKTGVSSEVVRKHLKRSAFIYNTTAKLFLEQSLHLVKTYLQFSTLISFLKLPFLGIQKTMNQLNASKLKHPKLVQLFNRYATYNGSNPFKAPSILHIIPHLEFNQGAFFPERGMESITNELVALAKRQGVVFKTNQQVEKILTQNDKAIGVKVNGIEELADVVVCNMDIVPAYRNLLKQHKAPEKILAQERSSSALIFYWGIQHSFDQLILHNILFSEDYKAEFQHIFEMEDIFHDPTIYINISSKHLPTDAPNGCENWFVMINVPANKGQDWDKLIKKARTSIIEKINRVLKTDIESFIVQEDYLDPRRIDQRTFSYQGALYGTASNDKMAAFFRHPNFSHDIDHLYFCGGSVHPGGGIPLALSSAKIIDGLLESKTEKWT